MDAAVSALGAICDRLDKILAALEALKAQGWPMPYTPPPEVKTKPMPTIGIRYGIRPRNVF